MRIHGRYEALDRAIGTALERGRIPGAAVALVSGNDLLFAKGYGCVGVERGAAPVALRTYYPPASTIKAMTATVIGMLVDDGLLAWDAPIRRYLPEFALADEAISRRVTLRDLLAMRTGLPAHEYVWIANDFDRTALLQRLAHLPLSAGLHERFQYTNLGYAIAGHAAERVTGTDWEKVMRERLFEPLGMAGACFDVPARGDVVASYHENWARRLVKTRRRLSAMIAPAGGTMYATLLDMARWVSFNLGGGCVAGRALIQSRTFAEIMTPVIEMGDDSAAPSGRAHYALGWFIDEYRGVRRVSHTGYLDDVNSCVTLFPEAGIGLVSYTTFASSRLAIHLNELAFDAVTGRPPGRVIADAQDRYDADIEARIAARSVRSLDGNSADVAAEENAGTYCHGCYGTIEVRAVKGVLELRWNCLRFVLSWVDGHRWVAIDQPYWEIHKPNPFDASHPIQFIVDDQGQTTALLIELEPATPAIQFQRVRAASS